MRDSSNQAVVRNFAPGIQQCQQVQKGYALHGPRKGGKLEKPVTEGYRQYRLPGKTEESILEIKSNGQKKDIDMSRNPIKRPR